MRISFSAQKAKTPLAIALYNELLTTKTFEDIAGILDLIEEHGALNLSEAQVMMVEGAFDMLEKRLAKIYKLK